MLHITCVQRIDEAPSDGECPHCGEPAFMWVCDELESGYVDACEAHARQSLYYVIVQQRREERYLRGRDALRHEERE